MSQVRAKREAGATNVSSSSILRRGYGAMVEYLETNFSMTLPQAKLTRKRFVIEKEACRYL
jgi:hypothetical protein